MKAPTFLLPDPSPAGGVEGPYFFCRRFSSISRTSDLPFLTPHLHLAVPDHRTSLSSRTARTSSSSSASHQANIKHRKPSSISSRAPPARPPPNLTSAALTACRPRQRCHALLLLHHRLRRCQSSFWPGERRQQGTRTFVRMQVPAAELGSVAVVDTGRGPPATRAPNQGRAAARSSDWIWT